MNGYICVLYRCICIVGGSFLLFSLGVCFVCCKYVYIYLYVYTLGCSNNGIE